MIWPDVSEHAPSNPVAVYVTRLRRRLGDLDLIASGSAGYALRYPVEVDVLQLEEAIAQHRTLEPLEPELERVVASRHPRLPQWILTSEWLAPYARRYENAIRRIRQDRARVSEGRDAERAQHYRRLLAAEDAE
jgi:hypothetical protein